MFNVTINKKIYTSKIQGGWNLYKKRCNDMWEGHNSVRNFKMSLHEQPNIEEDSHGMCLC